jgi:Pvc16 N-terminal domain
VIHEVDEALRRLVREVALRATDIEVSFDAPTKDWAARRNAPTVNVYLYDIREDMRRRQRGMLNEYGPTGQVAARHLPPRHIKLSYLITAWTQRAEDEHRLLSDLLTGFLPHEAMPAGLLNGSLSALGLPVPMTVALPPPEDRAFADVWTALGGELKPSLDVVVSAPIESGRVFAAGPPVEVGLQVELDGDDPVAHRVAPAAPAAGERRVAMVRRAPERR